MLEYMKLSRVELMIRAKTDEEKEDSNYWNEKWSGDISACLTMNELLYHSNVHTLVEMETFLEKYKLVKLTQE